MRRNLHAFLLSPFKSQGDEVEQEVPSRSLRTVYLAVSCSATVCNFLFVAKIVSRVRLNSQSAPYFLPSSAKRLTPSRNIIDHATLSFFIRCNFDKRVFAVHIKFRLNIQICNTEICVNEYERILMRKSESKRNSLQFQVNIFKWIFSHEKRYNHS